MVREYRREISGRPYARYNEENLRKAVESIKNKKLSYREACSRYSISLTTLHRHVKNKDLKKYGGQTALSQHEGKQIAEFIGIMSDWGFPLTNQDCNLVINYLEWHNIKRKQFNNNCPSSEWIENFLNRNDNLKKRLCSNKKRARAGITVETIENYFSQLGHSLEGVPPQNLVNYDETNFVDDPGNVKVLVRRTCKYPSRILDSTKTATSVMFAVAADGMMLPPYVVYRPEYLWEEWTNNGPPRCRYNR